MTDFYEILAPDPNEALKRCEVPIGCLGRGACFLSRFHGPLSETFAETAIQGRETAHEEVELVKGLKDYMAKCGMNILLAETYPDTDTA